MLPKRFKVDNGSEFISKVLNKWAYENNVELDQGPGKSTDNPFIEIFNGSFKDECLNANWFFSLEDAQKKFDIGKRTITIIDRTACWETCLPTGTFPFP